jgi:hypothetical protein
LSCQNLSVEPCEGIETIIAARLCLWQGDGRAFWRVFGGFWLLDRRNRYGAANMTAEEVSLG